MMKINKILNIILLFLIIILLGCNKDNNDDPNTNTESFFTAKINGETIKSKKVVGGSLLEIFQFVPYNDADNAILAFTIYHYKGVGSYKNSEDITIQFGDNIYRGIEGGVGEIEIEFDNQLVDDGEISSKGHFNCILVNLLDESDKLEVKDAEFYIRKM